MRTIARLFRDDMRRLFKNAVTGIIVLGLVLLPSIFSWFNVLACWDVFDNTGNLKVAVANTDEGYKSDLVPLKMQMGEQVVSALRGNDQLDWVFTSEEDAVDGARSGRYYAAVVIPPSFSKDMMTFYSDDVEHAKIVYYTNEKKSAVAPKVTDQGADQVSYQVNVIFAQTLSEMGLSIATSVTDYMDSSDASGQVAKLAQSVDSMSKQMDQAANVLTTYARVMDSAQALISGSAQLIGQAKDATGQVSQAADQGQQAGATISDALEASANALDQALVASRDGYAGVSGSIDSAFDSSTTLMQDSTAQLRNQAASVDSQITQYQALVVQLQALKSSASSSEQDAIQTLIDQLKEAIKVQEQLRDALVSAADKIEAGNTDLQADRAEIKDLANDAQTALADITDDYQTDVKPAMDNLRATVANAVSSLQANTDTLMSAADDLQGSTDSVSAQLASAKEKLDDAARELTDSSTQLKSISNKMTSALASGNMDEIRAILSGDSSVLSHALAAPVELDRIPVFPADNFGSQMAPLYTTLALWIGSLLLVVAIRTNVSDDIKKRLGNPKLHQLFLGRFGVFAVLSFLQSSCMAIGNLLFLGVQANEPFLYLVCFWVGGLVFSFITYALVASFANLGKAIAVFLLIIQVTSGGGSFPLPLLPQFFQVLSPYLPATHVINAMRAAMMGVYNNDFWIELGLLLLFIIPFALLGLVLRKPLLSFLHWYIGKVEDSKLVA